MNRREQGNPSKPVWLSTYTSVATFLLVAIALVVPSGYSVGAVLLLLVTPILLSKKNRPVVGRQDWAVIGVLLAYFLVCAFEVVWDGQSSSGFDKPSRFLLAVPVLLLLLAYPPKAAYLWAGLAAGGIVSGFWATWQKLAEGVSRAGGYTHVIQFGNLNMLLGILCLAGLGWAYVQPRARLWFPFLLLGGVMGILGSLMSGSRGGWVGFPFVLLVLYQAYGRDLPRRWLASLAVVVLVGAAAAYAIPQLGVQQRVHQAFSDISRFVEQDNPTSSLGARFEMWGAAVTLIPERPIVGWGSQGYLQARDRLVEQGRFHPIIQDYEHVHNEYLDAWVKRGFIGLIALLALYLVPLRLFAKRMKSADLPLRALATAGVLLPLAYMDFGLSQVFLSHNSGVMMFAFLLVVLWASVRSRERTGY
ncbi:MAG: O-antigen ligase [Halomonas sp.]|nr:O-antigen ligase [Halomonas sp.]